MPSCTFDNMNIFKAVQLLLIYSIASGLSYSSELGYRLDENGTTVMAEWNDPLDIELNKKYQKLLVSLERAGTGSPYLINAKSRLIVAQRSWIKFRDNDCRAFSAYQTSNITYQSRHADCLRERTKQRVRELDEWIRLLPQPKSYAPYLRMAEIGKPVAGQPLSVWIQRYWQWERSFPSGNQPSADNTGSLCQNRQNQDVFFLSGSVSSSPITRKCTLPTNKYILIPISNVLAQFDGKSNINCDTLQKTAREANEAAINLSIHLSNMTLGSDFMSKIESGCFNLTDNTRGVSGLAAGAGFWVVLEPLKPGQYFIRFTGKYLYDGFYQDVSYHIEVE